MAASREGKASAGTSSLATKIRPFPQVRVQIAGDTTGRCHGSSGRAASVVVAPAYGVNPSSASSCRATTVPAPSRRLPMSRKPIASGARIATPSATLGRTIESSMLTPPEKPAPLAISSSR